MPLKLVPPQEGRSPNWRIRGTYLGTYVDRSAGTARKELAAKELARLRVEIECGRYAPTSGPTFLEAARLYLRSGKRDPHLKKLMIRYGGTLLSAIDQIKVDAWAAELYPQATAATQNRQVYTPVAAVLHHAYPTLTQNWLHLRRPQGAAGEARTRWLTPEQVAALIEAAGSMKALLIFLVGTGCRLGEAVALDWSDVALERSFCYLGRTKNGDPRGVHLPPAAVAELANTDLKVGSVFGFKNRFEVYEPWQAMTKVAGLPWVTPHVCRHTYGTWMRVYGGLDEIGLLSLGVWKDRKSVTRYSHAVVTEEARKADLLPIGLLPVKKG